MFQWDEMSRERAKWKCIRSTFPNSWNDASTGPMRRNRIKPRSSVECESLRLQLEPCVGATAGDIQAFVRTGRFLADWLARDLPSFLLQCFFWIFWFFWSILCEILLFLTHASFHMLNKSLHACRLRLRTKANRCNHGHLTSRITEVIDTQHHVSLKYSKRSLCAVCRWIFPGTRSVRGGKMRRAAKSPKRPKIFFQNSLGANRKQENRIWAPDTPNGRKTPTSESSWTDAIQTL